MLAVVPVVVREKEKGALCIVLDIFHVIFGRTFMSGLRTKNLKKIFFCSP